MTTYPIKNWLFLICFLSVFRVFSQDGMVVYFEPTMAFNYKVATNYSHNFEIGNRNYLYDEEFQYKVRQLEITHFSKLNIGIDQSIALGIRYRFRENFENDKENELRLTEQYNITDRFRNMRIGNRLRVEQRISPSLTTHRFRYRFAVDAPLNGEKLDVGEAYVVASTESLLSAAQGNKPEFDQRLTGHIGWLLTPDTKLQTGLEYRVENYGQTPQYVMLLLTSLVFSL